jgi:hypothetical protein
MSQMGWQHELAFDERSGQCQEGHGGQHPEEFTLQTSPRKAAGAKASTVVMALIITGPAIRTAPSTLASRDATPCSCERALLSPVTMASSTNIPSIRINPVIVIIFTVKPKNISSAAITKMSPIKAFPESVSSMSMDGTNSGAEIDRYLDIFRRFDNTVCLDRFDPGHWL